MCIKKTGAQVSEEAYIMFRELMYDVADSLGAKVEIDNKGFDVYFTHPEKPTAHLMSYDIGLNSHNSHARAKDKTLCSDVLRRHEVRTLAHFAVLSPESRNPRQDSYDFAKLEPYFQRGGSMVVKPNAGGGGDRVTFVSDYPQMVHETEKLLQRGVDVALTPFHRFDVEYRCIVLDGEVLMSFGKRKEEGELQHNLSTGAHVVNVPDKLKQKLHDMAIASNKALGLRFSAVDIMDEDGNGDFRVLEVNGSVTLKRVLLHSPELYRQSLEVYRKAILAFWGDNNK